MLIWIPFVPKAKVDEVANALGGSLRARPWDWLVGGVLAVAIVVVYAPIIVVLADRWENDSRYSHGWLVPLFSLFLLYSRRRFVAAPTAPSKRLKIAHSKHRPPVLPMIDPRWWGALIVVSGL